MQYFMISLPIPTSYNWKQTERR